MSRGNRGRKYIFSPNAPTRVIDRAEGPEADMLALAYTYRQAGWTAETEQIGDSPVWSMIASTEGDPVNPSADVQNTHELRVNVHYPDIKANLHLQSQFTTSPAVASIAFVQLRANQIMDGSKTYEAAVNGWVDDAESPIQAPDHLIATQLLDLLLLDRNLTFPDFQYVYTHTFNYGSLQDAVADFSNVRAFFDTSQLIATEGVPDLLDLPAGEWLKLPPEQLVELGGQKVLKYEYWWADSWTTLLYAPAI